MREFAGRDFGRASADTTAIMRIDWVFEHILIRQAADPRISYCAIVVLP
jgi:hypothetical protein